MAKFNTDTLSLFHTFSKTQVNSDATKPQFSSLGNTVNKSGHTVQSNEIWTEAIPFFGLGVPADFSSTAQVNDLVKDADGVIWQRNDIPYTDANGTYWTQKTKSITSFTKGTDGKYTFTEEDGALVDGSYLLNAAGVPTVKYHAKKQLTPLVSSNNAFIDSEKDASRLKIDGKWVEQFIGVTDVYVNGSAAVSYAPVLFSTSTATSPLKAGAGEDYLDYCATGIILWDKNDCTGNEVISCFEYVGTKLDATVAKLTAAVFGDSTGEGGEEDISISEQVAKNTTAINVLNGADTVAGSVAKTVKDAIDNLGDVAVKSDITITDIKVQQGSGAAESLTITDKSVTIEIPEVPAADVTEEGVVTIDGFTKTADVTNLANAAIKAAITSTDGAIADAIDGAISDATLTSGDNAIQSATGDTATKLVTAEQVKEYVTENAQVTLTVAGSTPVTSTGFEFAGSTGTDVTVTPTMDANGKVTYSATLSKATVEATTGAITNGSLAVSASNAKTIAEKAIETALADTTEGSLGDKIKDVQDTAAAKVADVTVDGTSIVGTDKVAKLTTTGEAEIESSATTSTKLATEASVAKSIKTLEGDIEAITTGDGSIGSRLAAVEGTANTAVQTVTAPGAEKSNTTVTITSATLNADNKSFTNDGYFVKASDVVTVATTIAAEKIASIETTGTAEIEANAESTSTKLATEASVAKSIKTLEDKVTTLEGTEITQQSVSGAGITVTLDGTVGAPTLTGSVTTASYTPATEGVKGSWSDDTKVAKASDVKAAIADVETAHGKDIQTLQTAVNGLTTTGLTREVLPDGQTTANIDKPKENVIYLVKDTTNAESGSYIEYLYVNGSFEAIGTTKTDLSEYVTNSSLATTLEGYTTTAKHSDLESVVSALSQVVTNNKIAAENAIKALDATPSGNGITVTQVDGVITTVEAAAGEVAENNTDVVTGGVVYTAIKSISDIVGTTAVSTQINNAIAALDSTKTGNGITVTLTDGKVTTVSAADGAVEKDNTNVVTGGVVYTAVEEVKAIAEAKISAVQNDSTHFGSPLVTTSDTTVTVSPAKEWSVSDVTESLDSIASITSVINGKMSNGSTIDDANLTDGTSMFANNTALTTYVGDLGKLTTGTSMFSGCTSLTTFVGDLGSLTDGTNMFANCKLTEESLIYIVDSLPTFPVETPLAHTITVGVATGVDKAPYVTEAAAKGWALV